MLRGMSRLLPSVASSDAFHIVHCPLEVPEDWLHKFDFIDDSATRQTYHAMVAYMDQVQSRPHISKPNFLRTLISERTTGGGECHDADSSQGQHVAEHPHRDELRQWRPHLQRRRG